MRRWLVVMILVSALEMACADGTATGVQWPGWRVETSEYPDDDRYPITNMLDGDAATAWVHYKDKDGRSYAPTPTIIITPDTSRNNVTIDAIGLTNGYAKDTPTYWRNNRIRTIELYLYEKTSSSKQLAALTDTREIQIVRIPRRAYRRVEILIRGVDTGRDNDLCVSELALYDCDKPAPWRLTPVLAYNRGNDCGCGGGPQFALINRAGQRVSIGGVNCSGFEGFSPLAGTTRALLCTFHDIYGFDFATLRLTHYAHFDAYIISQGWVSSTAAVVVTSPESHGTQQQQQWYRLEQRYGFQPRQVPVEGDRPPFLSGARGPNYGA